MTSLQRCILLVTLCLATTVSAAVDPKKVRAEESAAATAIQKAFEARDGKTYRRAMTERLARVAVMPYAAKVAAVAGYRDVVKARGGQGLEGLLVSAHAALAASGGKKGYVAAQDSLAALRGIWRIAREVPAPNAVVAVKRPADRFLHHLPVSMVRTALVKQMRTGVPLVDQGLAEAHCGEAELAAFEARYGKALADQMRAMCNGGASSAPGGGEMGLGMTTGLSLFDCLTQGQQTRADRFQELMQACTESMVGKGGGNPFADGERDDSDCLGCLEPLETYDPDDYEEDPEQPPPEEDYTETETYPGTDDVAVEREYDGETGQIEEIRYYNEDGDLVGSAEVTYDGDGNIDTVTHRDADGNAVAVDTYSEDENGDITVTTETVPKSGADLPGELGETPECQELTLFLVSDRVGTDLAAGGQRPPRNPGDPSPDDPVENPDPTLDCLNLTGGMAVERSLECRLPVMCGMDQIPDGSCGCKPVTSSAKPQAMCAGEMRCLDGSIVVEENGSCRCDGGEAFVDATGGIGPLPMGSRSARTGWSRPL